jgi:hypothetical protein
VPATDPLDAPEVLDIDNLVVSLEPAPYQYAAYLGGCFHAFNHLGSEIIYNAIEEFRETLAPPPTVERVARKSARTMAISLTATDDDAGSGCLSERKVSILLD